MSSSSSIENEVDRNVKFVHLMKISKCFFGYLPEVKYLNWAKSYTRIPPDKNGFEKASLA